MGTVRQSTKDAVGIEFEKLWNGARTIYPNGLPFRPKQTLQRDDYWKLFIVRPINPPPAAGKSQFNLAFNASASAQSLGDTSGRYAGFDPSTDFSLLLPDGKQVPLRDHQVNSLQKFLSKVPQNSIFMKDDKLWYRSATRKQTYLSPREVENDNLRIISPLDDKHDAIAQAMRDGDTQAKFLNHRLSKAMTQNPNLTITQNLIRDLLKRKADVNARVSGGRTPLHVAASASCMAVVRDLVASKVDIRARDAEGRSALHWAAEGNALEVSAFLIGQGSDVNARTCHQCTPLT